MASLDHELTSKFPQNPSVFSHNPLPDETFAFRLLRVLPASDTGLEVCCELVASNLAELPDYRALSYVWGDPDIKRNIYIEGKPLPVTRNCYAALACIRRKTTQVTLWIDAICINQIDLKEKNRQLTIMVEIYAKAEEVLIWMGLNNASILEDSNLEQLRYVEKLVVATIVDLTNSSDLRDQNTRYKTILVEPSESNIIMIWGALVAVFSHEWWTRLWVHQELAVSKKATVVVGDHTFAWGLFISLLEVLSTNKFEYSKAERLKWPKLESVVVGYWHIINSNGFQSIGSRSMAPHMEQLRTMRTHLRKYPVDVGGIPIHEPKPTDLDIRERERETMHLLQWTRRFHCTDPRDHVFALRGLLTDGESLAGVGYEQPIKNVYASFTRAFIELYQSTNILRLAGVSSRFGGSSDDLGNCSSWIPSLGTVDDFGLFSKVTNPLWTLDHGSRFAAARDLGRQTKTLGADELLSITGYLIDTLDIVRPFFKGVTGMSLGDYNFSVWRQLIASLPLSYPTGCEPKEALFRVLTGNRSITSKDGIVPSQKRASDYIRWLENGPTLAKQETLLNFTKTQPLPSLLLGSGSTDISAPSISEKDSLETARMFEFSRGLNASITTATTCRQFLRTSCGFVGLAPQMAEIGDEVWILLGCDVPMLLRKYMDHYILVGECFVYGMMEGEQTKSLLASGSLKTINLR